MGALFPSLLLRAGRSGLSVLTANIKHFGQIEGLQTEAFVP